MRPRSGADIATIFPPRPTLRLSMSCWRRFRRSRSTCSRTITLILIPLRCSSRSGRSAKPSRQQPEWRRSSTGRCAPRAAPWSGKAKAATKSGTARSRSAISRCRLASPAGTRRMPSCGKQDCRKRSEAPLGWLVHAVSSTDATSAFRRHSIRFASGEPTDREPARQPLKRIGMRGLRAPPFGLAPQFRGARLHAEPDGRTRGRGKDQCGEIVQSVGRRVVAALGLA